MFRRTSLLVALLAAANAGAVQLPPEPDQPCELTPGLPAEELPPSSMKVPALPPVEPLVVSRVSRAGRKVALTFDACSVKGCAQYDERITQVLIATETPATVFLGGRWADEQQAHVKELAANPRIELGNHTWSHPMMTRVSSNRRREEMLRTQAEVFALTGTQPLLFRPPFGTYDMDVVRDAAKLGLTTVEFDLASGDPDEHATKERLIEWVLRKAGPGSIVVMHINRRGWHTAEALPAIIDGLHDRGYELVTVGELLKSGPPDPTVSEVLTVGGTTKHRPALTKITKCTRIGARAGFEPPAGCASTAGWVPHPRELERKK